MSELYHNPHSGIPPRQQLYIFPKAQWQRSTQTVCRRAPTIDQRSRSPSSIERGSILLDSVPPAPALSSPERVPVEVPAWRTESRRFAPALPPFQVHLSLASKRASPAGSPAPPRLFLSAGTRARLGQGVGGRSPCPRPAPLRLVDGLC